MSAVGAAAPTDVADVGTATAAADATPGVSTLELFLDLVFVFTVSRVTALVAQPGGSGVYARAAVVMWVTWFAYNGYSWLASNRALHAAARDQLLIFAAMAGFLLMAITTPTAFAGGGVAFGLGYLAVALIHAGLYARGTAPTARAITRVVPINLATGALILLAGLVGPGRHPALVWPLWLAAAAVRLVSPVLGLHRRLRVRVPHFVERHRLLVLIALGESVFTVGDAASSVALTPRVLRAAALALALVAAVWWSYVARDAASAEAHVLAAAPARQVVMATWGFTYAHLPMVAGIVLLAAGLESLVAGRGPEPDSGTARNLALGLALYLAGDVGFRRSVGLRRSPGRAVLAAFSIVTIPVARPTSDVAQLVALLTALVIVLVVEGRTWRPPSERPGVSEP